MAKLLTADLSTPILRFKPGGPSKQFDVAVYNHSPDFATFQLELLASGVNGAQGGSWYRLAPDLSAMIPAGDRTQFSVQILAVPPVPGGFVGTMTLTVRVFSLELQSEDRQVIKLIVEGKGSAPLQVKLARPTVRIEPGKSFEIPVTLHNPNRTATTTRLGIEGLPESWFVEGQARSVSIAAQGEAHATFLGRVPKTIDSISQTYPFQIEAAQAIAAPVQVSGDITIVPAGVVELDLQPGELEPIEEEESGLPQDEAAIVYSATDEFIPPFDSIPYILTLKNQSNVTHTASLLIEPEAIGSWWRSQPQVPKDPITLAMTPETVALQPGESARMQLYFTGQRPILGLPRHRHLKLKPTGLHPDIGTRPKAVRLTLKLPPRVAWWLQAGFLVLSAVLLVWILRRSFEHQGAINTVQFNGQANEVVSGSVDQSIHRWRVSGRRLRSMGRLTRSDKAIRVLRYRPLNNNALAVGFENGEIQLWDLLSGSLQLVLSHDPDDRVFDLQFSSDARWLYSGHGSGKVIEWDLTQTADAFAPTTLTPERSVQVGFAVQGLALVGDDQRTLAIAGRYNNLLLWQMQTNTPPHAMAYPRGGQEDYISQLATAAQRPYRLATADNQGRITVWDLGRCLTTDGACTLLDERADAHDGEAIQAIALSDDGCYLASGGDDGMVKLWTLDPSGQLNESQQLAQFNQPIKSVDVVRLRRRVLVVSGGQDHRIRLYDVTDSNDLCR